MNTAPVRTSEVIRCPGCSSLLGGPWVEGVANQVKCQRCKSALEAWTFPALRKTLVLSTASGATALEGESTCFFHPDKRAEISCERCGRFLCALCNLPLGTRHLCPTCLATGAAEGGGAVLPEFVQKRISWPRLSLEVGLLPLVFLWPIWPLYVVTGPVAVFAAIYGWNKPGSLVHGRRAVSASLGAALGCLQIAAVFVIGYLIWRGKTHV